MTGPLINRGDALVLVMSVLLVTVLYFLFWHAGSRSTEAMIQVNGKNWARINLFYNQDLRVPGPLGDSQIEVHDGVVRFVDSPCPSKQCVLQGAISQGGEVAVCLPNLVSIRVLAEDPRFDTMNY